MNAPTKIVFLRSKDDKEYKNKLAVLLACRKATVEIPDEVAQYFGYTGDVDYPLEINALDFVTKFTNNESIEGFEIKVKNIPKGVDRIRFFTLW